MKLAEQWACLVLQALLICASFGTSLAAELPVLDGQVALASVNGEPITGDDLRQQVESFHGGMASNTSMVRRPDPGALLQRIVNAKLVVQESVNIGLDELPEVQSRFEVVRTEMLKRILAEHAVNGIDNADPAEVDSVYREQVREVGVDSLLFETEDEARSLGAAVRNGEDFASHAARLIEEEKATGSVETQYFEVDQLLPIVLEALAGQDEGAIVGPLQVGAGFAVIRYVGERFPEDPEVRAEVESRLLLAKRQDRLREYTQELRDRYSKVDQDVLDSLDLDTTEGALEAARSDERIVAEIVGAEPVTVSEITGSLEANFFHGLDGAVGRKRVNEEIAGVLDRIILARATELESARLGVEQSLTYKQRIKAREEGILFETFITKVINPEVTLDDEELTSFYSSHLADYSSPVMVRVHSLAFSEQENARQSMDKLRNGADLKWTKTHADGQVDRNTDPDVVQLNGELLAAPALPTGIRQAVDGASAGDLRLHAEPDGPFYVLSISEVFPATPRPFAEVREQIAKRVFVRKRQDVLDQWTEQLREASEIEVYASQEQLMAALGLGAPESP